MNCTFKDLILYYCFKKINMKSIALFFKNITMVKKALLVLTPILTVMLNLQTALAGLGILIFFDLLTGVRKSFHKRKVKAYVWQRKFWREVKSYGMRATWKKTYEYGMGIIVFAVLESMVLSIDPIVLMSKSFTITELAIMTAAIIEVYSNYENMEAVSGNNLFKRLLQFLPEPIKKIINFKKEKKDGENI